MLHEIQKIINYVFEIFFQYSKKSIIIGYFIYQKTLICI